MRSPFRLALFVGAAALVALVAIAVLGVPALPGLISSASRNAPDTPEPLLAVQTSTLDWLQVQRDPQRTGYTPETLGTTFKVAWTYPFQPEKVYPQTQAIVYSGKVFVGTEMGNLYAVDAKSGTKAWTFKAGGPILNSVAAGDG